MNPTINMEIGQTADVVVGNFKDRLDRPAQIEPNSGSWAILPDEAAEQFAITPGETTGEQATASVQHTGTGEIPEAELVFTADGDPDTNQAATIEVRAAIVVDSPNAVKGDMNATVRD